MTDNRFYLSSYRFEEDILEILSSLNSISFYEIVQNSSLENYSFAWIQSALNMQDQAFKALNLFEFCALMFDSKFEYIVPDASKVENMVFNCQVIHNFLTQLANENIEVKQLLLVSIPWIVSKMKQEKAHAFYKLANDIGIYVCKDTTLENVLVSANAHFHNCAFMDYAKKATELYRILFLHLNQLERG